MSNIAKLRDIALSFDFKKGDYIGAETQLSRFAELYSNLNLDEADILRTEFDAKVRLGWLRIASTLIDKSFANADTLEKENLCKTFFAMYSFENLDSGYDGVMDLIAVSEKLRDFQEISMKAWEPYKNNICRVNARRNLEDKIFS